MAFKTMFGWVLAGKTLAGNTDKFTTSPDVTSHHVATVSGDDLLRKFWEI